jgi:type I restriction enzyme M protein
MATDPKPMVRKQLSKDKLQLYMRASSHAISRESIAALLLLRWIDYSEAEREAIAIFEDAPFNSMLPSNLQWRALCRIDFSEADQLAERIGALGLHLAGQFAHSEPKPAVWVRRLLPVFERLSKVNSTYLLHELQRVAELPFETASERLKALEFFDNELDERSDPYHAQHSTPVNIARLVAALASPQPGERIYDPCFGSGNLLIEANLHSKGKQESPRSGNPQLDVTGMEINEISFLVGLVRMLLAGIEAPCVELGNSLEREPVNSPGSKGFDLVVANPPIGAKVPRDAAGYKHFAFLTTDSTGLFIQHALSQLQRNGRAVIAVPDGFLFRGGADRELRRHLLEQGLVEAVIGLPPGVLQPWTGVSVSLLVLQKAGGIRRVKLARLTSQGKGRQTLLNALEVESIVSALKNPNAWNEGAPQRLHSTLRKLTKQVPQVPDMSVDDKEKLLAKIQPLLVHSRGLTSDDSIYKNVWEVDSSDFENYEWDLTPRRREKGGLDHILASLKETFGETGAVVPLSSVAQVMAGRVIKSADLVDEQALERGMGYVRIKDLIQGKVGRTSSWLRPELANLEQRWALLPGDVLMSKSGTLGKAAIVSNGAVGGIAASGIFVLRADQERLDAGFLLAYMASPACQNWLSAQSRGAVTQHLNRAVLDELPIPLPPLPLQARAAAQFRDNGTDALTFLTKATVSSDSDRINSWLADLEGRVPKFVGGMDDTPPLARFEPVVDLVRKARNWVAHAQVGTGAARWLMPLNQALLPLSGVSQIPPGPGLLAVLQDAERGVHAAIEQTTGHLPIESQARAICERLREWLRATIADLISANGLKVRSSPASLVSGSFSEFSVELENPGALPLRNLRVETQPDWGGAEIPYLAERGVFGFQLRGDVPKQGGDVSLRIFWRARSLSGQPVEGEIELVIRVTAPEALGSSSPAELGGSPYVTGSPLEPQHGHSVFYGREELIGKISRQIETHGNVVLLEGNRRAGKTSILKHLEGRFAIPGWLSVYASLQGAEGAAHAVGVPTPEVFREIARSIATALTKLNIEVPLPNGQTLAAGKPALGVARACREGISPESPFTDFREYLELVLTFLEPLGLGLVLMLDEFDKLQEGIDNGVTSPQVPENIRFLIQTYSRFSAILTGSRRLKRLREEYWSALYGLGTSIPVTALDTESARKVVTEPVRDQLVFSQEAIERVIELTARHPYLMQCLCNRVFDYAVQTKSRSITVSAVNDAAHTLVRDNEHFASLWDYAALGPDTGRNRRQLILLLCALSFKQATHIGFGTLRERLAQVGVDVEDELLDADLSYLRELELIEFSGEIGDGEYRLAIPLMADWIEQQQDADVVASRARNEAEEENA